MNCHNIAIKVEDDFRNYFNIDIRPYSTVFAADVIAQQRLYNVKFY